MKQNAKTVPLEQYQALAKDSAELIYIISHDFNAPLRHIKQFNQLLMEKFAKDETTANEKKYKEVIERSIFRSELMLDSILTLSRMNTTPMTSELVDIGVVIENAKQSLAHQIESFNVSIICSPNLPTLKGDSNLLQRLFFHLFDNAMKFQKGGGICPEIIVSATHQQDEWVISVTDNGIGIEEGLEENVFKLFKKLHSDESYAGIGAGLTFCRKIVGLHGGRIWCARSSENGSTFMLALPAS